MGMRRGPGHLEQEVLGILAAASRPLTPGEVRDRLDRNLAYTTVMTVLSRLTEKGAAVREPQGRGYAYSAVTDPAAQVAAAMHRAMAGNDHAAVLQRFVRSLSPADEQVLSRLLHES
jgi:predicted transcriptional regulator